MENNIQKYSLGKKIGFFLLGLIINGGIAWILGIFFIFLDSVLDDYIFLYDCSTKNINILHFILNLFIFGGVFYLLLKMKKIYYIKKNKYIKIGFYVGYLFILIALYIGWAYLFEPIDICECGCS